METILLIFSAVILLYVFRLVYKSDRHFKWFRSLKPGDRVLVRIYSCNCDCEAKGTITSKAEGKYIYAILDNADYKRCKTCSLVNGDSTNGTNTCWYNITRFSRGNVAKLEE